LPRLRQTGGLLECRPRRVEPRLSHPAEGRTKWRIVVILIMGVSGAGKTTIGRRLADELGWQFSDGDDFHPAANLEKMRNGHALTDADRQPWLERMHAAIVDRISRNQPAVLACSVLKASYRAIVEEGCRAHLRLVYLKGSFDLFHERLTHRRDHFMPRELLAGQFAILEEPADALVIDAALLPDEIIRQIRLGIPVEAAKH
jgi:gluconokinase